MTTGQAQSRRVNCIISSFLHFPVEKQREVETENSLLCFTSHCCYPSSRYCPGKQGLSRSAKRKPSSAPAGELTREADTAGRAQINNYGTIPPLLVKSKSSNTETSQPNSCTATQELEATSPPCPSSMAGKTTKGRTQASVGHTLRWVA